MSNIFWNHEERRMRMLWRMILALGVLAIVVIVLTVMGTALGTVVVVASSGQIPDITQTDPAMSIEELTYHPMVRTFMMVFQGIGIVVGILVAGRLLDRRKFRDFGFHFKRQWWMDLSFGLVLGAVCMVFIFLVELAFGWIEVTGVMQSGSTLPFGWGIILAMVDFIIVGIQEELISRGYLMRNLAEGFNWRSIGPKAALLIGYFLSSSVFGLLHLGNPNTSAISTINLIVAGFFLGLGFFLTGELAIPIGVHITWNFFQGNVFGFPVSGTNAGVSFIAVEQGGPDWVTGGAFGPEAGVIGLLAIALGCWLTIVWVKRRRGTVKPLESLAVFRPQLGKVAAAAQPEIAALAEDNQGN